MYVHARLVRFGALAAPISGGIRAGAAAVSAERGRVHLAGTYSVPSVAMFEVMTQ
jgi:hypothetical protein